MLTLAGEKSLLSGFLVKRMCIKWRGYIMELIWHMAQSQSHSMCCVALLCCVMQHLQVMSIRLQKTGATLWHGLQWPMCCSKWLLISFCALPIPRLVCGAPCLSRLYESFKGVAGPVNLVQPTMKKYHFFLSPIKTPRHLCFLTSLCLRGREDDDSTGSEQEEKEHSWSSGAWWGKQLQFFSARQKLSKNTDFDWSAFAQISYIWFHNTSVVDLCF